MKCTREHGGASHVWEVRMEGRGFDLYHNLAVGVIWAAERLAVAYLDATALGTCSGSKTEPYTFPHCSPGFAVAATPGFHVREHSRRDRRASRLGYQGVAPHAFLAIVAFRAAGAHALLALVEHVVSGARAGTQPIIS